LLAAVEAWCVAWPPGSLHVERFAPRAAPDRAPGATFEVFFQRSGVGATVPVDMSIAEVALQCGIDIDTSCGEGTCGTCEAIVVEGEAEHLDSVLTEVDRADGAVMLCVSRSRTARLVLDL
jgi:ferredoxin